MRVFLQNPPPINLGGSRARAACISSRCRTPTPTSSTSGRRMLEDKMREHAGPRGRQQRPAAQEPAGQRATWTATRSSALGLTRQPGRDGALQRVRHAPGLADLRAEQSVPGHPAGRAGVPGESGGAVDCSTCGRQPGQLVPLDVRRRRHARDVGPLAVSHTGQLPSVTISFNLKPGVALGDAVAAVQTARARRRCRRRSRRASRARRRRSRIRCRASACPARWRSSSSTSCSASSTRASPPADDSLGAAVGRLRRAADAADLQDRAEPLRVRRHHHARRPREEERHHDGGLRRRGAAARTARRRRRRSTRPVSSASGRS